MVLLPCFSLTYVIHANIIDTNWVVANEIRKIQGEKKTDFLSAYIYSDEKYPTYYSSKYFYDLQKISRYYGYSAPYTNNLFLKYHQIGDYVPLTVKNGEEIINVDVFCNPFMSPTDIFPINLLYGEKTSEWHSNSLCKRSYMSKALAEKLGINENNYKETQVDIESTRQVDGGTRKKQYRITTLGVIDKLDMSVYNNYINNQYYIFTCWSEDMQTSMNSPDFNVLLYKDVMKNRFYTGYIKKAISGKATLIYEDSINLKYDGVVNKRLNNVLSTLEPVKKNNSIISSIFFVVSTLSLVAVIVILFVKKKGEFLLSFRKNIYTILLIATLLSLLFSYYLFPYIATQTIINLNETATPLLLVIMFSIEASILTFDEQIDAFIERKCNDRKPEVKNEENNN